MKAQCLPFRQIPHTTRLFLDYLSYAPAVQQFYPRSPNVPEWRKDEASRVRYDESRRTKISQILDRQNRAFGSGPKALANVERLRRGAVAAVTGQQVGLFGGPLFSIFKALTAVKLADEATAVGIDCVPIFWLATEDHDLAEVTHVSLIAESGAPESLAVTSHGAPDAPVGTVPLGPEVESVIERAAALLGDSDVAAWLREAYRPGETLGSAYAKLFAHLFADWGVILLDPADKEMHEVAKPLLLAAVERCSELNEALLARGKALEAAGYHQQVKVTSATTPLFQVRNGSRTPIRQKNNGSAEFLIGDERLSPVELLEKINSAPEEFNPNVLLRPVLQDYLLPTLTYTGGAAEVAYFAQVGVVYDKLLDRITPVLPRFSATLVEPKQQRILEKYSLGLPDLFHGPEKLREVMGQKTLPSDLKSRFEEAKASLEKSMGFVRFSLNRLDPTLVEAASNAEAKIQYQLSQLEARAARAETQRNEVLARHVETLSGVLFPNKVLQEREIAGVAFVARYGPGLLKDVYETVHTDCHDHQIVSL